MNRLGRGFLSRRFGFGRSRFLGCFGRGLHGLLGFRDRFVRHLIGCRLSTQLGQFGRDEWSLLPLSLMTPTAALPLSSSLVECSFS